MQVFRMKSGRDVTTILRLLNSGCRARHFCMIQTTFGTNVRQNRSEPVMVTIAFIVGDGGASPFSFLLSRNLPASVKRR